MWKRLIRESWYLRNVIFLTSRKLVVAKINPLKVFVISFFLKFKELVIVLDDVPGENRKTEKRLGYLMQILN